MGRDRVRHDLLGADELPRNPARLRLTAPAAPVARLTERRLDRQPRPVRAIDHWKRFHSLGVTSSRPWRLSPDRGAIIPTQNFREYHLSEVSICPEVHMLGYARFRKPPLCE